MNQESDRNTLGFDATLLSSSVLFVRCLPFWTMIVKPSQRRVICRMCDLCFPCCAAEKVTSLGKDWHRPCLRCHKCRKTLSSGSHAEVSISPWNCMAQARENSWTLFDMKQKHSKWPQVSSGSRLARVWMSNCCSLDCRTIWKTRQKKLAASVILSR